MQGSSMRNSNSPYAPKQGAGARSANSPAGLSGVGMNGPVQQTPSANRRASGSTAGAAGPSGSTGTGTGVGPGPGTAKGYPASSPAGAGIALPPPSALGLQGAPTGHGQPHAHSPAQSLLGPGARHSLDMGYPSRAIATASTSPARGPGGGGTPGSIGTRSSLSGAVGPSSNSAASLPPPLVLSPHLQQHRGSLPLPPPSSLPHPPGPLGAQQRAYNPYTSAPISSGGAAPAPVPPMGIGGHQLPPIKEVTSRDYGLPSIALPPSGLGGHGPTVAPPRAGVAGTSGLGSGAGQARQSPTPGALSTSTSTPTGAPGSGEKDKERSRNTNPGEPATASSSAILAPSAGTSSALVQSPEEEDEDEDEDDKGSILDMEDTPGPSEAAGGGAGRGAGLGKKRRPHATRRRVVQSCSECRRRKIRCDKKFPCGPCVLRGDQARCHEVGMAEKNVNASPSNFATAAELALVAHRLDALEASLLKTGALLPADLDHYLKTIRSDTNALTSMSDTLAGRREFAKNEAPSSSSMAHAGSGQGSMPKGRDARAQGGGSGAGGNERKPMPEGPSGPGMDDEGQVDDTEGAALTLEHLAFGRSRVDGAHAIPHFGARIQSSISKHAPNNDYHLNRQGFGSPTGHMGSMSAGTSPVDPRRKSSANVTSSSMGMGRASSIGAGPMPTAGPPPGQGRTGSASSLPGQRDREREQEDDRNRRQSLQQVIPTSGGVGKEGDYNATLSQEEKQMRIDALLDLIGPTDIFDLFYRKTDVALRALSKVLPSRERGELLVRTYLEKVDWLHRCLHVPTFLRQCHDLWAIPLDMVVYEIALPFVALYFTVCCLGMQFMDADEVAKNFTLEEASTLPDLLFNAARSSMWAADFVATHTTEHLQCLILLGVFMNNRDRGEAAWALLGAAIKMAQGLGLSRLGAEQQAVDGKPLPMWIGRWESLIQREVGRRIWWNLVFLDWALAPSYNFSSSIQPDQIKTALPANVEDEDLIDDQPLRVQPIHVRTGMSFTLARMKFAEITHRQIWQANNHNHPPYSFILSVDGELRKAMLELPSFFQPDPSDRGPPTSDPKSLVQYYEKIMLNLAIHSRMLRLHRPWLSRGYADERFAYSKEQCIRAARASLRMMSDTHGTAAFLEKWWLPLFYVSVSGLVVIIDLLRTNRRDMHSSETEQKINEVKGALQQMRQIADVSHPSRAAVKVMEFLLAEVEERRRPPGSNLGKRKASPNEDEDDGLQRAVKKLIRQAQLEADSPSHGSGGSASTPPSVPRASISPMRDTAKERPVFGAYPLPPNLPYQIEGVDPKSTAPTLGLSDPTGNTIPPGSFPMPTPSTQYGQIPTAADTASGPLNMPSAANMFPPNAQSYIPPGPFNFPIDPTAMGGNIASFPVFPQSANTAPQLDPSVESLLANYFPQALQSQDTSGAQSQYGQVPNQGQTGQQGNQMNSGGMGGGYGNAGLNSVPDDFLSRIFSFSWDTGAGGTMPAAQNQNPMQGQGQGTPIGGQGGQRGSMMSADMAGGGGGMQGYGNQQGQGTLVQGGGGQGQHGGSMDFGVPFEWGNNSGGWMA